MVKVSSLRLRVKTIKSNPICERCGSETEVIGEISGGFIKMYACPHCEPELFAEIDRMKGK